MALSLTIILIAITVITSLMGFSNQKIIDDLIFYPPAITKRNQWYRFITCGFIHADTGHLVFNMISFYFFGKMAEDGFIYFFKTNGELFFVVLYFSSLIVCLLPTFYKNRDSYYYKSLGASGAVSAVIFASICMLPEGGIRLMLVPFDIPGFIFGPLYLVGCVIMDRRKADNINHSAHFWGAVYGIFFFVAACFIFTNVNPFTWFVNHVSEYITKNF
jgi:membrane associated rhomboid family serine protease